MKESKKQRSFKILIALNFIFSLLYILSGDNVMGLIYLVLAVTTVILELVSDAVIMLYDTTRHLEEIKVLIKND